MDEGSWQVFFKEWAKEGLLLLVVIGGGSLCATYMIKNGNLSLEMVSDYFGYKPEKVAIYDLLFCFWQYLKKLLLIFTIGLVSWMSPLSMGLIIVYIFAYGFSITAFLAGVGIEGHGVLLVGLMLQSIIMIMYLLALLRFFAGSLLKKEIDHKETLIGMGLKGFSVCIAMSCIQVGIYTLWP